MIEPLFLKDAVTNYEKNIIPRDADSNLITSSLDLVSKSSSVDNKTKPVKNSLAANSKDATYYLTDRNIQSMIMTGKESVEKLLFPIIKTALNGNTLSKKEKDNLIVQLKNDLAKCKVLIKNEFQKEYIDRANQGIEYFTKNINNIVSPYTVV